MASVGTFTSVGVLVLTAALGYGGRVLQEWLANRTKRADRMREWAERAQTLAHEVDGALEEWNRGKSAGSLSRPPRAMSAYRIKIEELEKLAVNMKADDIQSEVASLKGMVDFSKPRQPLDRIQRQCESLRDHLARFVH